MLPKALIKIHFEKPIDLVREQLIAKGIWADQAGYYAEVVTLLRDFVSDRRIIATLLEKQRLIYLALAIALSKSPIIKS